MGRHKLGKENFRQNLLIAILSALCILAKTADASMNVSFVLEPANVCLYIYSAPVSPPVFYCKVDGLTEDMSVVWLRDEVPIAPQEYLRDYALSINRTEGMYDLKILRRITRFDDRSRYSCAVYLLTNSSDPLEWTLLQQSQGARLRVNFFVPAPRYPECSISLLRHTSSVPSVGEVAYNNGMGFTIKCCSETVNPEMELMWLRGNQKGLTELVGENASRKTEKDPIVCLPYDVVDHQSGDAYSCHLTIPRVQIKTMCRRESKPSNATPWFDEQKRSCRFQDRSINLIQQNPASIEHDATFTCSSKGAIEYLWQFAPKLDRNRNQYHVSEDGATVLLNLDSLDDSQYNITCTAIGENSIGSRSLIVHISQSNPTLQNVMKIVAVTLAALVVLGMILLLSYVVKTRLLDHCKDGHSRGRSHQEMRARIQIRRNIAGNSGGLYAYPSSRMTSSSITPLMEGPEDSGSTIEHERPPSPIPPSPRMMRPGLVRPLPLQGAVGGIILDEEEMVECEYQDESEEEEFELDPKSMNVEGLQYADLEFSEDEEFIQEPDDDDDDDSESGDEEVPRKTNGAPVGKPKIDYANIVHFDPRRNSDPRRDSESRQNESRLNTADPWRKNTNV